MLRTAKTLLVAAALLGVSSPAWAFSLGGPLAAWQTQRLGYLLNMPGWGLGPMNIGEEYRWNIPVVYYGFTPDFLNYFGPRGAQEIDKAFQVLNQLPSAGSINPDAFPLRTVRLNHRAGALGLTDIRSLALSAVCEAMGAVNPVRFVYTLRNRWTITINNITIINYFVIRRNFDPITWQPSSYINGQLWTYTLVTDVNDAESFVFTEPVDPLALLGLLNSPVTSGAAGYQGALSLAPGSFWTGLTRDDAGAFRYIYRPNNYNVENFITNATGTLGAGPWGPPPGITNTTGTNVTYTNVIITTGLRAGVGKVSFQRVDFDSLFGTFEPFTNSWTDTVITNSGAISQYLERPVVIPDILFDAADLQGADGFDSIISVAYANPLWENDNDLNGIAQPDGAGPGTILPGFVFQFNSINEIWWNSVPGDNADELTASKVNFWGSFDGTTNEPVVYPVGASVQELEQMVLQQDPGFPWAAP